MSNVMVTPELVGAATTDLATVASTLEVAHLEVASPTLAVAPAAADEVSVSIAQLFSQQGADYQKAAGEAAAYHEQFVQHLRDSAGAYASAEAVNAASLPPAVKDAILLTESVVLANLFTLNYEFSNLLLMISPDLYATWSGLSLSFLFTLWMLYILSYLILFPGSLTFPLF